MSQKIAVVLVAALTAAGCYGRKTATANLSSLLSMLEPVVTGSFVVDPRNYKPFKVVVGAGAANARLEGTFSASGANNDIEVLLLEESQYLNWQNRHKFTAVYESGRVTADKIRLDLPADPATYFIVFSNRFSLMSKKAVIADLSLRLRKSEVRSTKYEK